MTELAKENRRYKLLRAALIIIGAIVGVVLQHHRSAVVGFSWGDLVFGGAVGALAVFLLWGFVSALINGDDDDDDDR